MCHHRRTVTNCRTRTVLAADRRSIRSWRKLFGPLPRLQIQLHDVRDRLCWSSNSWVEFTAWRDKTEAYPSFCPDLLHKLEQGFPWPVLNDGLLVGKVVRRPAAVRACAKQLSLLIAVGIGLHNFAEGLAIGQAAAKSEIALATLLVVGFGLHNATEGFGIVAPLAGEITETGEHSVPSWGFLIALGAIGGGPTFVGTAVGHAFRSEALSVVFLSLAAGSILYVVIQLTAVAAKKHRMDLFAYGLLIGLVAGFLTDAIVTAAGV